jgi:hypothetical protein
MKFGAVIAVCCIIGALHVEANAGIIKKYLINKIII